MIARSADDALAEKNLLRSAGETNLSTCRPTPTRLADRTPRAKRSEFHLYEASVIAVPEAETPSEVEIGLREDSIFCLSCSMAAAPMMNQNSGGML